MGSSTIFAGDLSPFRAGFLKVALFISGAWVNVSMDELGNDGVTIQRNGQGEPSRCGFRLKDPIGKWNNRHPSSPYFGLIGRGTPLRVQVEMTTGVVLDRWYGEVVTWIPRWTKKGAPSAYVEVEAAGALRRLGQGQSPLRSPIYRGRSTIGANLVAYWPMEDSSDAKSFAAFSGTNPMSISGTPTLSTYAGFKGSQPLPTLESARLAARIPSYSGSSPQVRWLARIPSTAPTKVLASIDFSGGSLDRIDVSIQPLGDILVEGFNTSGASVGAALWVFDVFNRNMQFSIECAVSGGNVNATLAVLEAGQTSGFFGATVLTGVTMGKVTQVTFNPSRSALKNVAVGHLTMEKAITSIFALYQQLNGYEGELAKDRLTRLCAENNILFSLFSAAGSAAMGPQGSKELVDLLDECVETDGGMLYEPKSSTDISYRTLRSLYSQSGSNNVSIAYVENMLNPFEPVEDDSNTRNRVTVTRSGGSSSTVEETTGALGIPTVGVYDEEKTLSLANDNAARQTAGWRLHIGTTDEARWPVIGVDLADPRVLPNTALRDKFLNVGLGTLLEITSIPAWLPPFNVLQIVLAYTERITPLSYKIEFTCTPGRPYNAMFWNSAQRWSGQGTKTPALNSTQTTFTVTPPTGVAWGHGSGDYPIVINGEVMTVTNVVGNLFTVIRSVNGVVKSHAINSDVALYEPAYYGL